MEERFLKFVASIMKIDDADMSMRFKEGKWDSLMMLTLIMELEAEYGKKIPMERIGNIKTLADMFKLIKD